MTKIKVMEKDKIQKIQSLDTQIKILSKEKETLQDTCKHNETKVKFENGTNTMKVYCKECDKEIGYPSKEQISDFLK
jgi:hypothetical protein|tara:strand:- start:118 stop:348 length:231 start_codon:yes stop_codon:yes gene_type:complete